MASGVYRGGLNIEQRTHMDYRGGVAVVTEYMLVEIIHLSPPYGSLITGGLTHSICTFD